MAQDLNDIFNKGADYLDEVIILPLGTTHHAFGTYTLPAGYTWSDFEYVEFYWTNGSTSKSELSSPLTLNKQKLATTDWGLYAFWGTANVATNYIPRIQRTGSSSFEFLNGGSNGNWITQAVGYTKRYATRNHSAVVQLTDANTTGGTFTGDGKVQANQRYELDIASVLGDEYVGRDLVVQAEIYNDTGTGIADWGYSGHQASTSSNAWRYTVASTLGNKIVVSTGEDGVGSTLSQYGGSPFGGAQDMSTALCRIKVWKVEQYITPTQKGGAGKTVLYDGASVGGGGTVPLSDDMTKYDMVLIYASWNNGADASTGRSLTAMYEPDEILDTSISNRKEIFRVTANGSLTAQANVGILSDASTSTSLAVDAGGTSSWVGEGIYKVVGINYQ